MATTEALVYDDGSSTESEYYFDPTEEEAQVKQEPQQSEENPAIKEESTDCRPSQEDAETIQLPQGNEWSHRAAAVSWDNAVEQALAMASRFEREMSHQQPEEELTVDTLNINTSPLKSSEEEAKTATLKRKQQVPVKSKMVSLKSVKAPTPTLVVTKPGLAVGLRRPPSLVTGAPTELEKGLSEPRSTGSSWKSPGNQSRKTSLKQTEEKGFTPRHQTERKKSPSVRRTEPEMPTSSRRSEQSKTAQSIDKKRSRSPSRRRHTEWSNSPPKGYSRRSRSKSPSRRRVEETRKRSRSRLPYRSTVANRSRYRVTETAPSPRLHHVSEKRYTHNYERSRSPPRPSHSNQSIHDHRRSRSREHDRYDQHHEARHDHYDDSGRKSAPRDINQTDRDPHHPSHRESIRGTHRKQQSNGGAGLNRDDNTSPSERIPHKKTGLSARNDAQMCGRSAERSRAVVALNRDRSGSKSRLQLSVPLRSHRPTPDESSSLTALPNATKRAPTDPRIRQTNAIPHTNNSKKPASVYHDVFARRVFKLKLQEADVDEKTAAESLDDSDTWLYENRRRGIAAERARLMAQDVERFEKVYTAATVSKFELKRYQDDRDFAWRVVQFKRKQTSLQEQTDLFFSSETKVEMWRRLDQEREKLIAENRGMFHKVMMSQDHTEGTFKARERETFTTNAGAQRRSGKRMHDKQLHKGQAKLYRQAPRNHPVMLQPASANSRVVVGAALANSHNTLHVHPQPTKPWFLKG